MDRHEECSCKVVEVTSSWNLLSFEGVDTIAETAAIALKAACRNTA